MATYERFQILFAARQDLFLPEAPVWVSRCQLSLDRQSGKRLLQIRMVNCQEKPIRQVFLRIVCFDRDRRRRAQLELVPMQAFPVPAGAVFGEDRLVEIPVKDAAAVEAYAQRVRFADGSAWDEPGTDRYLAFPPPEPIRREDPNYEKLLRTAQAGGVRCDCYYRAQQGLWLCTCGMPNALRRLRCARCGADRSWLETHMDPGRAGEALPAAAPAAPEAAAVPESIVTRFVPTPFREEGPPPSPPPEPSAPETDPEEDSARIGRITAIAVAAVLALTLGVLCAVHLLMPWLRYREALREAAAGNYDRAASIFESLGDYRDSADRIGDSRVREAIQLMGNGSYREALELLEAIDSRDKRIPDCLYALGVEAYNARDLDAARDYLEQLEERFPTYEGIDLLRRCCAYGMGNRLAFDAGAMSNTQLMLDVYQEAIDWFDQAGSYEDSAERILECRYRIACIYEEMGELIRPIQAFGELGDYKDSAVRRQNCMYSYVQLHLSYNDETVYEYLEELAAMGHPEASALWARFNGEGFSFTVTTNQDQDGDAVTDLSKVRIDYQITAWTEDSTPLVLVTYSLPDGKSGQGFLNLGDQPLEGSRTWEDLNFPTYVEASGIVELCFYDNMFGTGIEKPLHKESFRYLREDPGESPGAEDGG